MSDDPKFRAVNPLEPICPECRRDSEHIDRDLDADEWVCQHCGHRWD
jgi:ribosomal protein L37AE/L43A